MLWLYSKSCGYTTFLMVKNVVDILYNGCGYTTILSKQLSINQYYSFFTQSIAKTKTMD